MGVKPTKFTRMNHDLLRLFLLLPMDRYFVPKDWSEEDGGQLDLYDTDPATGHPGKITKSLVPVSRLFLLTVELVCLHHPCLHSPRRLDGTMVDGESIVDL